MSPARRFLALLAVGPLLAGALLVTAPVSEAAPACLDIEAQDWWLPTAGAPDESEPSHVHARIRCLPRDPVSGVVNVTLEGLWHNNAGRVTRFKFQDDGSKFEIVHNVSFTPEEGVPFTHTFAIDTSKHASSGWRLWRFYIYVTQPDGNTEIARGIYPVYVNNGKARKDVNSTWVKPTGWYKDLNPLLDTGYTQFAFQRTSIPAGPVAGGLSLTVQCSVNGGLAPSGTEVYVDPSFHDDQPDVPLWTHAGGYKGQVSIPDLPAGDHRIVGVCKQSFSGGRLHAGVGALTLPFE